MPPLLLSLPQLDLSWNELGSEGAKAVAESLKVNALLTEVLAFYPNAFSCRFRESEHTFDNFV